MHVLVIGGTGVISSAVVRRLVEQGCEVTVCNRGVTARPLPASVRHLRADRTARPAFETLIREQPGWDAVIDMVCYRPEEMESAVRAFSGRTAQYILVSTVDVYRKPATRYPYREDEPLGGIGDYATAKVACERIAMAAYDRGDLPVTIIRPGATYGDRHLPVHSLGRSTSYLDRLLRGKPIVVHGDGSSLWSSCHADDVAVAFVGAIGNPATIGRSYHVAGEECLTWNQHHAIIAEAIGAPPPTLVHIPTEVLARLAPERCRLARENLQFNHIFDLTAAMTDLAFRQTISLREGAARWYASLRDAGMIEDSDHDPFEDRLILTWERMQAVATQLELG